jgi:hypothetical protein
MRSVAASIHPSARKGLSENLAKAKFSEVRVHDAAQYTVSLPLRERDEKGGMMPYQPDYMRVSR